MRTITFAKSFIYFLFLGQVEQHLFGIVLYKESLKSNIFFASTEQKLRAGGWLQAIFNELQDISTVNCRATMLCGCSLQMEGEPHESFSLPSPLFSKMIEGTFVLGIAC